MARLLGDKVGSEICEVLKLDPNNIAKLDILLHANDVARIEITRFLESQELDGIKAVLNKYVIAEQT